MRNVIVTAVLICAAVFATAEPADNSAAEKKIPAERRAAAEKPATEKKGEATVVLHSTITGNQEQPKVLYIVPWQPPGGTEHLMQPVKPILDDVFAPVDRAEFQRELKYRAEATSNN